MTHTHSCMEYITTEYDAFARVEAYSNADTRFLTKFASFDGGVDMFGFRVAPKRKWGLLAWWRDNNKARDEFDRCYPSSACRLYTIKVLTS